jgi:hypothetical protein
MKNNYLKNSIATVIILLTTGCASVAITGDAIEDNTSLAIGLERGNFTISDRVDKGLRTTYRVKTNSGKNYRCSIEGTVSIMGRMVSDAMCTEMNAADKPGSSPATPCNALLKAAGKCK